MQTYRGGSTEFNTSSRCPPALLSENGGRGRDPSLSTSSGVSNWTRVSGGATSVPSGSIVTTVGSIPTTPTPLGTRCPLFGDDRRLGMSTTTSLGCRSNGNAVTKHDNCNLKLVFLKTKLKKRLTLDPDGLIDLMCRQSRVGTPTTHATAWQQLNRSDHLQRSQPGFCGLLQQQKLRRRTQPHHASPVQANPAE